MAEWVQDQGGGRRIPTTSQAHRGFQRFVDRLNAEREANGERRMNADTLRHLVHGRDFDGNDYDRLHTFAEENGPAMGSFLSMMGATEAEIGRCPTRTVKENDHDLLRHGATCPVCLERYVIGDRLWDDNWDTRFVDDLIFGGRGNGDVDPFADPSIASASSSSGDDDDDDWEMTTPGIPPVRAGDKVRVVSSRPNYTLTSRDTM